MFFNDNYIYFITIALQAICVIHCLRKGSAQKWIWLIIFLPVVGSLIYIFTEMFTGNEVKQIQSVAGSVLNPGGSIKRLEENLRFSDTFNNRIALADAYLANSQAEKAIELYESSLTGAFFENEHVNSQLIIAYFQTGFYDKVVNTAKKIYKLPQFARSKQHMLYAMALERIGDYKQAETEFKMMKGRFAYFECRYQYGLFLVRAERETEARQVFSDIVEEGAHLNSFEKRYNRGWVNLAKDELKKLQHSHA